LRSFSVKKSCTEQISDTTQHQEKCSRAGTDAKKPGALPGSFACLVLRLNYFFLVAFFADFFFAAFLVAFLVAFLADFFFAAFFTAN
jgi:hypothetical protein